MRCGVLGNMYTRAQNALVLTTLGSLRLVRQTPRMRIPSQLVVMLNYSAALMRNMLRRIGCLSPREQPGIKSASLSLAPDTAS